MVIDLTYDCASAGSIEAIDVTGFQSFSGFEEVNAVFLTPGGGGWTAVSDPRRGGAAQTGTLATAPRPRKGTL